MRKICLLVLCIAQTGCEGETQERLTAGDRSYAIPSQHISTLTREPHTFVRIARNDQPYDLIYDSRVQGRADRNGAPVIFSINDGQTPYFLYPEGGGKSIICRKTANARQVCGVSLKHGANRWSLLFPVDRLGEAKQFVSDASRQLQHYEASSR